jgi:pimeloyl-ACP methyl ester carboxylesterase
LSPKGNGYLFGVELPGRRWWEWPQQAANDVWGAATVGVQGGFAELVAFSSAVRTLRAELTVPREPLACASRPAPVTHPVVLVHGAGHSPGAWRSLAPRLAGAGFSDLYAVRYTLSESLLGIARDIDDVVTDALERSGADRVHLIAHSLGGVAVRVWHDLLGGSCSAAAVVTLGTPHVGSAWAAFPVLPAALRDLTPGSELLREATQAAVDRGNWTTIAGTFDVLVPPAMAHLAGSDVVDIPCVGHLGLLHSAEAGGHACFALLAAEDRMPV